MRFDFPTVAEKVKSLPPWQRWLAASLLQEIHAGRAVLDTPNENERRAADLDVTPQSVWRAIDTLIAMKVLARVPNSNMLAKANERNHADKDALHRRMSDLSRKGVEARLKKRGAMVAKKPATVETTVTTVEPAPLPSVLPSPSPTPLSSSLFISLPLDSPPSSAKTPAARLVEHYAKEFKCSTGKEFSVTGSDFGRLGQLAVRVGEEDVATAISNLFRRYELDPFWQDKPPSLDQLTKGLNALRVWKPKGQSSSAKVRHLHVDDKSFTTDGKVKL